MSDNIRDKIRDAILKGDADRVRELQLADPSAVTKEHLFLSAGKGDIRILKYLTEYSRISLNERDDEGRGVLHYAAMSDNAECCDYLVTRCGMDAFMGDGRRITPWETAIASGSGSVVAYMEARYGKISDYYKNPVRTGFFPDPSVIRAGSDYYMVNSSFILFPCIPISHSVNLTDWEIVGYAITEPEWADIDGLEGGRGYWAPDISYSKYDRKYYITATWRNNDTDNIQDGTPVYRRQMITCADRPEGPYSKPVFIDEDGIDPSLYHEDDGRMYMLLNRGARILEIDRETLTAKGEATLLYYGDMKRAPEGPHIYKRNGYYYLLMAEGGTGLGHRVTVMRSDTLMGEYEPCPYNPIMIQRDEAGAIQRCGHGDMTDTPDGRWYMVYLCGRLLDGRYSILGRETALDPVTWTEDGWPVVNGLNGPSCLQRRPYPELTMGQTACRLSDAGLPMDYMTPRSFDKEDIRCETGSGGDHTFMIRGSRYPLESVNARNIVLRRQTAFDFSMSVHLEIPVMSEGQEAGITGYYDENTWYAFGLKRSGGRTLLFLKEHIGDSDNEITGHEDMQHEYANYSDGDTHIKLSVECHGLTRSFYFGLLGSEEMTLFATLDNVYYLCDEGLQKGKRFTGALTGFYAYEGPDAADPFRISVSGVEYMEKAPNLSEVAPDIT